jgi:hypothetical protein
MKKLCEKSEPSFLHLEDPLMQRPEEPKTKLFFLNRMFKEFDEEKAAREAAQDRPSTSKKK